MKPMWSAAAEEIVSAVFVSATVVKTMRKKSSVDSSASATTSLAIVTFQFSALVPIMASVSVVNVNVTMVGVAMLANAALRLTLAGHQMVKSARDMELVGVESASARSKTTSDTRASTARSAQHVPVVAMS